MKTLLCIISLASLALLGGCGTTVKVHTPSAHHLGGSDLLKLEHVDKRMAELVRKASLKMHIRVIEGHRNEATQNKYYDKGVSQLKYPHSKHNQDPSLAVDIVPYTTLWKDIDQLKKLGAIMKEEAKKLGLNLVWGGDWKGFPDLAHFELVD